MSRAKDPNIVAQAQKVLPVLTKVVTIVLSIVVFFYAGIYVKEKVKSAAGKNGGTAMATEQKVVFHFMKAGEEQPTVMVGRGTYHRIHSNNEWMAIGAKGEFKMPSGWSGWMGGSPKGVLIARALVPDTKIEFKKMH